MELCFFIVGFCGFILATRNAKNLIKEDLRAKVEAAQLESAKDHYFRAVIESERALHRAFVSAVDDPTRARADIAVELSTEYQAAKSNVDRIVHLKSNAV